MKGRILAHARRKAPRSRSRGDARLIRKLSTHVERHLGHVEHVLHDLLSDVVHIDILWVEPGPRHAFHTFVTCGMSERPMPVSDPRCECGYAELLLRLPLGWPLGPGELDGPHNLWPLQELEHLARAPHLYETHLWGGHTVANGEPTDPRNTPEPLCPATRFCGSVLAEPDWTPPGFRQLRVNRGRTVRFFSVILLYAEELLLARDRGSEELFDHLQQTGVSDLLDVDRPNLLATAH